MAKAVTRLVKKGRLANPRHGFLLILRPEDQLAGAPDPVRWIEPLMKHQGLDRAGHVRQAKALESFVKKAKTFAQLDPAVKPLVEFLADSYEKDVKWRLVLNERVEIDF